jgi:hypothetical protein
MKLPGESAESGEVLGPKGEFNKVNSGRNGIKIPSGLTLAVAGFMKYAG